MISVSWIGDYTYCPLKLYLKQVMDEDRESHNMALGRMQHEIRRGFEEITKRNIWGLKEDMSFREIREALFLDVPSLVEDIFKEHYDVGLSPDLPPSNDPSTICENIIEDLQIESFIIAFKVNKILQWSEKPSLKIVDTLFPASLIEFSMKNHELNLKGKVDKIELLEGYYYPIEVKSGKPPVNGVWKSHAIQIAAYAILIEEKFKKEVPVGYVDYLQIGDRRTVIIDDHLREELFTVLSEMNSIIEDGYVPEIVQNPNKCRACDYSDFCEYCNE